MDWNNLGYIVLFGAMAFMMFRGGGCCGGGHRGGNNGGHNSGSHSGHGGCCGGSAPEPPTPKDTAASAAMTEFTVEGMTCQHCAGSVEKALLGRPGVSSAKVSLADKTVEVNFDPAVITVDGLKQAVREAGYQPQ